MYTIRIESQDESKPAIVRNMSADSIAELTPVIEQICKDRFNIVQPIVFATDSGSIRIFDFNKPIIEGNIDIIKGDSEGVIRP